VSWGKPSRLNGAGAGNENPGGSIGSSWNS
jgi:hypothetical protein